MERSLSKKSELILTLTPLLNSYIILAEVWFFSLGIFLFLTYLKFSSLLCKMWIKTSLPLLLWLWSVKLLMLCSWDNLESCKITYTFLRVLWLFLQPRKIEIIGSDDLWDRFSFKFWWWEWPGFEFSCYSSSAV